MSDNKKRVRLDNNNKIVIENDNAEITSEGTTSTIKGVYEIYDEDVEKLLVLINDNTLKKIISYSIMGHMYTSYTQFLTSDEALDKTLSDVSKEYNELDKNYKELQDRYMTMQENFDNLIEKVKKHNKNRLFNKIKIDELK